MILSNVNKYEREDVLFIMYIVIVGELCNFIAYAFTQAILVTPLGALSVVIRYIYIKTTN